MMTIKICGTCGGVGRGHDMNCPDAPEPETGCLTCGAELGEDDTVCPGCGDSVASDDDADIDDDGPFGGDRADD